MTTNCVVPPRADYQNRLFTTGAVGVPGCQHIEAKADGTKDFTAIIEMAKKCAAPTELEKGQIVGGFAHEQVFAVADKVVEAVKSGAIKKFVVMAGCDGRMKSRQYYADFAKALPKDTVILTAGCAKYKYIKLDLGDIGGIPRVLDAGQCNDSYSLAVIALKLKEISYINATGYTAGELKHGPIAMLDESMPVLSILMKGKVYDKILSNSEEAKARNARMIALTDSDDTKLEELFESVIRIPEIDEMLSPALSIVPLQLLAYYIAEFLGKDVDQPRNLAKSVTVE